jgi:hypothetical protein
MPILTTGNPKRLIGRDYGSSESVAGTYLLRQPSTPTLVFSWEVEGIDVELPERLTFNR